MALACLLSKEKGAGLAWHLKLTRQQFPDNDPPAGILFYAGGIAGLVQTSQVLEQLRQQSPATNISSMA